MTTTESHLPEVIKELQGIADGSGVCYNELVLLNLANEFVAILNVPPDNSHGVEYSTGFLGCTNISMETEHGQMFLVHTEDIKPEWTRYGLMLTADIYDQDQQTVLESWTQYIIPGLLPGGKFGFNSHGLIGAHNNIYQSSVNRHGLPRSFVCRSLLGCASVTEVREKLLKRPGIASGLSFQFVQTTDEDGAVQHCVIEVAGDEGGPLMAEFHPVGFYHHCNIYQHLRHDCHPEESSIHRAATISQYINRRLDYTVTELRSIISDVTDRVFPVYRNGESPDFIATASTGLYDVTGRTLAVYTDKPANSEPDQVFHIPNKKTT